MAHQSSKIPTIVSSSVICLIVGGIIGYYTQAFLSPNVASADSLADAAVPLAQSTTVAHGGVRGSRPPVVLPATVLTHTLQSIELIEKVDGNGLTHDQAMQLQPILKDIKSTTGRISEGKAQQDEDAIENILSTTQRSAVDMIAPLEPPSGAPYDTKDTDAAIIENLIAETGKG